MPEILIFGGHLDEPPAYAQPILVAYALASMNWGRLEQQLDMALISVNKDYYSPLKPRETPSTSFRIKLELFRDWFVKDPRFSEFHHNANRLYKSLRRASEDRVLLIHSNVQRFVEGPPVSVEVVNIHTGKGNVTVQRAVWSEDQIRSVASKLNALNHGLRTITERALTPDFLRSLEKA